MIVQDLEDWVIAFVASRVLVGRKKGLQLSPVFDLRITLESVNTPTGKAVVVRRDCIPLAFYASIDTIELPEQGVLYVACKSLSSEEQKELVAGIEFGEDQQKKARAHNVGLRIV